MIYITIDNWFFLGDKDAEESRSYQTATGTSFYFSDELLHLMSDVLFNRLNI
jgi:hypothetical protein